MFRPQFGLPGGLQRPPMLPVALQRLAIVSDWYQSCMVSSPGMFSCTSVPGPLRVVLTLLTLVLEASILELLDASIASSIPSRRFVPCRRFRGLDGKSGPLGGVTKTTAEQSETDSEGAL